MEKHTALKLLAAFGVFALFAFIIVYFIRKA